MKESRPLVVSWPATRNVTHWATMLWSGSALPCLVGADEHVPQQVRARVAARPSARRGSSATVSSMSLLSASSFALRAAAHLDRDREQALPGLGLVQRAHHRLDERVLGVAVERVEAVAEAAQRDRVEGQPRHVGRDVDRLVRVEPLPLEAELLGDVDHRVEVALHRPRAEAGQQDVVRGLPQRVVGVRGEQPGALVGLAELPLAEPDELVEAGVVAEVVDHLQAVGDVERAPWGWSS